MRLSISVVAFEKSSNPKSALQIVTYLLVQSMCQHSWHKRINNLDSLEQKPDCSLQRDCNLRCCKLQFDDG